MKHSHNNNCRHGNDPDNTILTPQRYKDGGYVETTFPNRARGRFASAFIGFTFKISTILIPCHHFCCCLGSGMRTARSSPRGSSE